MLTSETVSLHHSILMFKVRPRNLLQLDLYSNGIYGFYTSPTGKGFSGLTYSPTKETFNSQTCIAMECMVSIQVLLEKVSLVLLIVRPKKPFTVTLV